MKKTVKYALIVIAVICITVIALFGVNAVKKDINGTENKEVIEYNLVIKDADFQYQVAEKLKNNGIIISDAVWNMWMDKHNPDFVYINGEYNMRSDMSYEEIAEKLKNPDISHRKVAVLIPEGYNVFDIAKTLEENGVCTADDFYKAVSTTEGYDYEWLSEIPTDNANLGFALEGFLFPATYDLGENTSAHEVADKMLAAFDDRLTDEIKAYCANNGMSLYEFITLCSIVQEEALTLDSAEGIASVLQNRLDKGIKLQCDVTYFYAKKLRDYGFSQDVYDSYYTYRCPALPTGPITNSGKEIMDAVVNHEKTDYLFFFSDLKGEFHFASTGAEFEKLKKQYPWK